MDQLNKITELYKILRDSNLECFNGSLQKSKNGSELFMTTNHTTSSSFFQYKEGVFLIRHYHYGGHSLIYLGDDVSKILPKLKTYYSTDFGDMYEPPPGEQIYSTPGTEILGGELILVYGDKWEERRYKFTHQDPNRRTIVLFNRKYPQYKGLISYPPRGQRREYVPPTPSEIIWENGEELPF